MEPCSIASLLGPDWSRFAKQLGLCDTFGLHPMFRFFTEEVKMLLLDGGFDMKTGLVHVLKLSQRAGCPQPRRCTSLIIFHLL